MSFFSEHLLLIVYFILSNHNFVNGGRTEWTIEKTASFWKEHGRLSIEEALKRRENTKIAKNVILFLGDGMGMSTVTAGRIRKGQLRGELGEDFITEMEQFAHLGLAKTYNIDHQTPDSAATATAYLCGIKAQLGTLGLDGRAKRANCSSSHGTHITSILNWAQQLGNKVGIVTTARITHATPAAAYAHAPERNWEGYDTQFFGDNEVRQGCLDIAHQLVLHSPPIDIVFGGGRRFFFPSTTRDVENSTLFNSRADNKSLIDEYWRGRFIWNKTEMNKIDLGSSTPILGLFDRDHLQYESDRIEKGKDEPSLSEMTTFAIEHFSKTNQGFFLLIEGGKIDHGHHETRPRYALDEFVEFDTTIGKAIQLLKEKGIFNDTLLVVTADHSHVFTFGAYSSRGSNILGLSSLERYNVSDIDKLPINIIAYGNGPNFQAPRNATYLYSLDTNSTRYLAPTALPMKSETHGGEDVPVYAHGPWSHLFIGTMEQSTIAHKMAYAACWGDYINRDGCPSKTATPSISNVICSKSSFILTEILILFFYYIYFCAHVIK
ncbi:unnamed protein product [Rotaria socialis]|uniref:Alkaline phosphatase, tissue-nonspecific isozyme n=1 Tax=Rotaria socialis TaxID=392032 RepID=A0A820GTA1_9BILA|nr:unnamed protein product [Rotaria socialis]CAF3330141.1 unnamed protein product [Rotaria socialis]CAF3356175.1 unnamed protein product [Rotaria socialis]CAF3459432.1 unnamed protein product [Rotaria socialis]CAF3473465.1 unnamed protein product [Rotaria socialis]